MTEAIMILWIFTAPILAVAVIEQRNMELERRKRELALIRETEQLIQFKQSVLNTERQQVDKEEERHARMVD